jgi:ribonuclease BN (tRNA processing enzyme)
MTQTIVHLLGTGDAFGSGGRLQSCALVETGPTRVLVDCGASVLPSLRRALIDPNTVDAVLLTHFHGDHCGGVPFLLMDAHYASARARPLVIAGPPGVAAHVHCLHDALFAGTSRLPVTFDLRFVEFDPARPSEIAGWSVRAVPVEHSSHATCFGLRLERESAVVAFSGDTAWAAGLGELARGADLFVCECYGFESAPPGHLDYRTLMAHRADLACTRLLVTHMGEDMIRRAPSLEIETAWDGMVVTLER